jgi:hypothetical protein
MIRLVMPLALILAAARASAGVEALSAGAENSFLSAAFGGLPRPVHSVYRSAGAQVPTPIGYQSAVLAGEGTAGAAAVEVASLDLAALLNKQLKSPLRYDLGGKSVWVSGAFDRQQNAYVSILVDGQEARFFNVRGLLDKAETVVAGTARYTLYLAPNVINQMKSEIILENAADEDDKVRVTLKKMLESVGAAGDAATVSGQLYKVFYTDDVKNGQIDRTARTFTFLHIDAGGQIHVFLIPAELVPSDKIAVFKMHGNTRVGLIQAQGRLRVYENP